MIKITKDGRTIRTGEHYSEFRRDIHIGQNGRCYKCGRWMNILAPIEWDNSMHTHHLHGRKMGGGFRDDKIEACEGWCGACHRKEHNQ